VLSEKGSFWFEPSVVATYSDGTKANILYNNIIARKPQIKLVLKDEMNQIFFSACHDHQSMSGVFYAFRKQFFAVGYPKCRLFD
jgi:hypothetical protein